MPYDPIRGAAGGNGELRASVFERQDARYVVFWHATGSGTLALPLAPGDVTLQQELGGATLPVTDENGGVAIPVTDRCYLKSHLSQAQLIAAFENARLS